MGDAAEFETWAIVEVMGHKRFAGFVTEQVVAGPGFIRVDVPEVEGALAFTKILGTGSIYAMTPVGEPEARAAAAAFRERPIETWMVPQLTAGSDVDDEAF